MKDDKADRIRAAAAAREIELWRARQAEIRKEQAALVRQYQKDRERK